VVVQTERSVIEDPLDVLHGVATRVAGDGSGLTNRVNVPHVPDGVHDSLLVADHCLDDFLVRGVVAGHEVVLESIWVVRSRCVVSKISPLAPKPATARVVRLFQALVIIRY
jgi:hypothetical protein